MGGIDKSSDLRRRWAGEELHYSSCGDNARFSKSNPGKNPYPTKPEAKKFPIERSHDIWVQLPYPNHFAQEKIEYALKKFEEKLVK